MKNFFSKIIALSLVVVFVLCNLQSAKACGPFSLYAAFSYDKHPDLPFEDFARGELGILKPDFARSYLFVAYRYLNANGLTQQEQKAVVSLWNDRLGVSGNEEEIGGVATWISARKKVQGVGDAKDINTDREAKKESYNYYSNCLPDAFNKAAQTLEDRISKFGAGSQDVKDWVTAQDKVFSNCSEGQSIPDEASANAPAILKADRAYQIAAAYFYSTNFDEAKTRFERIAADSSSPHNGAATLLVARSLIRKASLSEDRAANNNLLSQAETQLMKVVSNNKFSAYHQSANNLLSLVGLRKNPAGQLHNLAVALSNPNSKINHKQFLWDYTTLMDKVAFEKNDSPEEGETQIPLSEAAKDDITDWLFTFGNTDKGFEHALERWEKTQSQAWLAAALTHAKGSSVKVSTLIQAAEKVSNASPAFYHINYHIARLQLETGQKNEARKRIDNQLLVRVNQVGIGNTINASTLNQILSLRMSLATSLDEFLKYAQRKPAGFIWDYDGNEMPDKEDETTKSEQNQVLFDYDATNLFNGHFPLATLRAAAENKQLPAHLRKRLAIAAFTRAVVLEREDVGRAIAPTLTQLEPSLKALIDTYLSAVTPAERKAAGLYMILKTPAMQPFVNSGIGRTTSLNEIDSYRDNWWCAQVPKVVDYDANGNEVERKSLVNLDFLTEAQKTSAKNEVAKLVSLGTAPNYLAQEAAAWAQRTPNDPRVAEALHLAVKSTRYGCTDENTGKYSKAAFDVLHKQYPNSTWAKQTPYWFKGN